MHLIQNKILYKISVKLFSESHSRKMSDAFFALNEHGAFLIAMTITIWFSRF